MKPEKVETYLGFLILFVLMGIAAGVFRQQSRYDAALFKATLSKNPPSNVQQEHADAAIELQDYLPEGMILLTPGERFGPENLSEKIDGKAELYLSSGFLSLGTQRFAVADKREEWLELFVYDMGNPQNAFSVYSTQRRADAVETTIAQSAYHTENSVFFQQGRFYVEIVGASTGMLDRMLAMGENFARKHPAEAEAMPELALFPETFLVPGSIALLAENVFGFERLSHTFVGRYRLSGSELTAFLAPQPSAAEAKEMAGAYHQFLLANGGEDVPMAVPLPDAWLVKVFDTFEVLLVHDSYVAGVHEAERRDLAEELALNLKKALTGK